MSQKFKFVQAKYSLSDELASKFVLSNREKHNNNIAGKPKILLIEIVKRFFTNPAVLIAFVVFFAIIIAAAVVTLTSPYPAVKRIDENFSQRVANFYELPPLFSPFKETSNQEIINNLYDWSDPNKPHYYSILKDYAVFEEIKPGEILRYDAYKYFEGAQLLSKLVKYHEINNSWPTLENNASLIAEFKAQIPHLRTFFGTNKQGSDIWTTVWTGTLESLWIALLVATVEIVIGVFVGAYLGFNTGKWLDTFMMRLIEIFTSPPSIIWLLLFVTVWGTNPWVLIAGLLFVGWTGPIGVTRLFIITVKDEEYILAAKSIGASTKRQIFLHALPAILGKIALSYVRRIPSVILSIASLAFLGFFKDDNSANLGKFMLDNLSDSKTNIWLLILPAFILLSISISLQFIAVGLHDALDPKVIKVKR
ncbi:ABC transporter permease [Mycoplasmopsis mucosicanis]|uniref:ABC transporter permease n=1 Tax=Mycoplasmopsis mucosicanis TaxID=458208 RepID=A0A507SYM4_9BACT|nr:ABC transporter permease [Mycoplasmopsis mucosicanis]TQC54218.1 ABC transporter permease [Mycoplasmopsis mucosicanis]